MKNIVKVLVFLLYWSLVSCTKPPTMTYFGANDSTKNLILPENEPAVSIINREDILAITIVSLSQETNQILNFNNVYSVSSSGVSGQTGSNSQPLGFIVDSKGEVELPLIGKIYLVGLNLDQASQKIRIEVEKLLKNPSINVRFLNHKFSILGEVARPGVYNLVNDRTTLPDALAMAGDLSQFANRTKLTIIRNIPGKREMIKLDLTSKEIFSSPYYYIQDSDIIYIDPLPSKAIMVDRRFQLAPLVLSAISTTILLLNILTR